jgi:hypothetical protein
VTTSTIPVVNGLACAAHRRHVICASLLLSWDLAAYPLEAPGEIQDGQVRLSAKIDQACDYEPLRSATPVSALVLCRTWSPDFAQFLFRALPKPYTRNFRIIGIGILPHLLPLARCRWSTARSRLAFTSCRWARSQPSSGQVFWLWVWPTKRHRWRCSVMCLPYLPFDPLVSLRLHRHRAPVHLRKSEYGTVGRITVRIFLCRRERPDRTEVRIAIGICEKTKVVDYIDTDSHGS